MRAPVAGGRGIGGDDHDEGDGAVEASASASADPEAEADPDDLLGWFRCLGPEFVMGRALLEPNPN